MAKYINEYQPVYFSYSWANAQYPDIEDDVKNLCAILEKNNIYYKRDKDNLSPWCVQIDETEKEIGRGAIIIVVISKRYIESLHCMHEWHRISEGGNIKERVLPIVLDDANILDKSVFLEYYNFFTKRREELVRQQLDGIIPLTKAETNAAEFDYYVADLKNMYQHLVNTNFGFKKDNEYSTVIKRIKELLSSSIQESAMVEESAPEPEEKPAPKKPASPAPKKTVSPAAKKEAQPAPQKPAASTSKSSSVVDIDSLSKDELTLLQHMVMWGSDSVYYDMIEMLLADVVSDLRRTLKKLSDKKLLEAKKDSDGDTLYKIPAKILQALLDMDITADADYEQYADNIKNILLASNDEDEDEDEEDEDEEYDEEDEEDEDEDEDSDEDDDDWFAPFVPLVVKSVLEYGILNDDCEFLYLLVLKLNYDDWSDEAKKLLLMAEPLYLKKKLDKEDLRSDLVDVYYQLGYIAYYHEENNEDAEEYYRKAIKVAEAAQSNDIASRRMEGVSYIDLGDVLSDDDDRYDEAVDAYNKAIKILQGLRKYEDEYDIDGPLKEAKDSLKQLKG